MKKTMKNLLALLKAEGYPTEDPSQMQIQILDFAVVDDDGNSWGQIGYPLAKKDEEVPKELYVLTAHRVWVYHLVEIKLAPEGVDPHSLCLTPGVKS